MRPENFVAFLSEDRVEQVENLKIAAEIELAGLAARQQALDSLIKNGEQRIDLLNSANGAEAEVNGAKKSVSSYEKRLSDAEEAIKSLGPLRLREGKVAICPVKWVAASND